MLRSPLRHLWFALNVLAISLAVAAILIGPDGAGQAPAITPAYFIVPAVFIQIAAAILAEHLRQRIEVPFAGIAAAVRAVAKDDFSVRAPLGGGPEIAAIARQFNVLADTLIAQRKSLEEHQLRLRSMLRVIQQVIYSADSDGLRVYFISPAAQGIFGHPPSDFYANPLLWASAVVEEDRWRYLIRSTHLAERGTYDSQYRIRLSDGEIRWLLDQAWLVRDDKGNPVRVDGIITDVTERWRMEQALRAAQAGNRSIAESVPLPLAVLSRVDSRVMQVNEAFCRAIGGSSEKIVGRTALTFYDDPSVHDRLVQALQSGNGRAELEVTLKRSDGAVLRTQACARAAEYNGVPAVFVGYAELATRTRDGRAGGNDLE